MINANIAVYCEWSKALDVSILDERGVPIWVFTHGGGERTYQQQVTIEPKSLLLCRARSSGELIATSMLELPSHLHEEAWIQFDVREHGLIL